jgi:hypothetical protein
MKTAVVFKKIQFFGNSTEDLKGIEEVNAIFPEHSRTDSRGELLYEGYAHIGQHTEIHEDFLNHAKIGNHTSVSATPEEYAELKAELEQIGYELEILN